MTIDERLQALTESVELLTSLHRDLERETTEKIRGLALVAEQNEVRAGQMMDAITRTGARGGESRTAYQRFGRLTSQLRLRTSAGAAAHRSEASNNATSATPWIFNARSGCPNSAAAFSPSASVHAANR